MAETPDRPLKTRPEAKPGLLQSPGYVADLMRRPASRVALVAEHRRLRKAILGDPTIVHDVEECR